MPGVDKDELSAFVTTTFDSIWSLELLLHLRSHETRAWSQDELVTALRASNTIVAPAIETLTVAGLLLVDSQGAVQFAPANDQLRNLVTAADHLYRTSPGAVRRMIINASHTGLTAFADAFRLRKD